jgi:hypothetical protein
MHDHIGIIESGQLFNGPFAARAVCVLPSCQAEAAREVHAFTGKPANPLVTYEEYRQRKQATP